VVVLHLVIIGGGFAAMALGEPIAALVLLVVLKIVVDIAAHRREHAAAQPTLDRPGQAPAGDRVPRPSRRVP
jgi:hypothetical protein